MSDPGKQDEKEALKEFANELFGEMKKQIRKDKRARAQNIIENPKKELIIEQNSKKLIESLIEIILGVICGIFGFYLLSIENIIVIINFIPGPIFLFIIGVILIIHGVWSSTKRSTQR